jgi:gluconolactonase
MMGKAWVLWGAASLAMLCGIGEDGGGALAQDSARPQVYSRISFLRAGQIELVASGYTFTEGPVWDGTRLIFSDIPGDTVYVYTPGEGAPKVLYTPSALANGHTFDREGQLLNAEHGSGAITRWTAEGGRQVVVESYEGKHLNSPNDLVVRQADGMLFFTDPPYGLRSAWQGVQRGDELGFSGVYAFDEASGRMVLIDNVLARPNGIAFSPDEATLYVSDSATQTLWAYTIAADGSASNKRLVIDLTDPDKPGSVDGVRVDRQGLIYMTCPGGICVVQPSNGRLLERVETPKRATNLAWGGPALSQLYITAQSDVYRLETGTFGIGSSSRP